MNLSLQYWWSDRPTRTNPTINTAGLEINLESLCTHVLFSPIRSEVEATGGTEMVMGPGRQVHKARAMT